MKFGTHNTPNKLSSQAAPPRSLSVAQMSVEQFHLCGVNLGTLLRLGRGLHSPSSSTALLCAGALRMTLLAMVTTLLLLVCRVAGVAVLGHVSSRVVLEVMGVTGVVPIFKLLARGLVGLLILLLSVHWLLMVLLLRLVLLLLLLIGLLLLQRKRTVVAADALLTLMTALAVVAVHAALVIEVALRHIIPTAEGMSVAVPRVAPLLPPVPFFKSISHLLALKLLLLPLRTVIIRLLGWLMIV
jgi:hypothetical protein